MKICPKENCTGCGACAYICPKHCITMKEDEVGVLYPFVDTNKCIKCDKCIRTCPFNCSFEFSGTRKTYAAWSSNLEERKTSASGGIAAEIYRYADEHDITIFGAKSNSDFSVSISMADTEHGYQPFKNSKYVFSNMKAAYPQIREQLHQGKQVIFVGLPCQVAAVKRLFPKQQKLFTIDLVCHGVMPYSYLKQHIALLQETCGQNAERMSFRDADCGTYTFTFTLHNKNGDCIYAKRTKDWDSYQVAYHRMIAYRENCYHCKYAKSERLSDLTLSDYKGLGTLAPWEYNTNKVSSVLIHTEQGMRLMEILIKEKRIVAYERPVNESIQGDPQLQHPSEKSKSRLDFEQQIYTQRGDFEKAMKVVIRRRKVRENWNKILNLMKKPLRMAKRMIKHFI